MDIVYWVALALLVIMMVPATAYYGAYVFTGQVYPRMMAVRFCRWAVMIVLATFNIAILKHILLTIFAWL
ncbi:MAG: hypothetical protein OEM00_01340 [Burkholderiaceae bacterium]|nr:hypothetical protein [Burkholderiaceae bacterium]MDH3459625.1 hypothetical protein [Burkholderiaceae bacterium]